MSVQVLRTSETHVNALSGWTRGADLGTTDRVEAAAAGTHDAVVERCRAWSPGELLDAPSGDGSLAKRLEEQGFVVSTVDRVPSERPGHHVCDLNDGLPFDDASFDHIVSVEGIEHLHSPVGFLRELARVAKPDAGLIITTPNVLSVRSRWRWLTRGFHRHFTPQPDGSQSSEHLHPLPYPLLAHLMETSGFEVQAVFTNRLIHNLRDKVVAKLLVGAKAHPRGKELMQEELLFGQILGVEARRLGE